MLIRLIVDYSKTKTVQTTDNRQRTPDSEDVITQTVRAAVKPGQEEKMGKAEGAAVCGLWRNSNSARECVVSLQILEVYDS